MSRLDVLMPHFRDPEGLALSLASVAGQSWTGDIRIIIVDDGSPGADFRAVEALAAAQELPVVLERNTVNRGRPYTRNRLLDAIDSPYVAWLDAGDVWYPAKIEKQFEQFSRLRLAGEDITRYWITCHYDWQWTGRKPRLIHQDTGERQVRELMLGRKLRAYLWTLLGTAESFRAAGRFDERLPRLQDLDYFLRFVLGGGTLTVPEKTRALCLYHKSDLGRNAREIRRCNRLIRDKYNPHLRIYGPAFLRTIRYNADMLAARFAGNNGERLKQLYYMGSAVADHPKRAVGAMRHHLLRAGK
ncbi:MAG: glycosyltransferase family 2 protein [Rhodobacteraceae bacterium]|uniref:glycosyltransferase family 2 protein n=1 Tax=Amaricoccus sp. B4 TaxID=3368557 RepID=UPI000DADE8E5|nr:glycosyltransferase family 2 protein [Paracoccaceae bacterium]